MKLLRSIISGLVVMAAFIAMALACATPAKTTYKPRPCVKHKPLSYSPIMVKINLGGNYTMKDLPEAQRTRPAFILDAMNGYSSKYKLVDGVTPNLTLGITVTTDGYEHYGATVNGYVYDGDFYFTVPANYITFEKLYTDIATKVDGLISGGWCNDCPSPCNVWTVDETPAKKKK
jgi:hypothetical protein